MVEDIRSCGSDKELVIYMNGGSKTFDKVSPLKLFHLDIYFNTESMANILSLKDVVSIPGVRISMDSTVERAITVEHEVRTLKFKECCDRLYSYDIEGKSKE